MGSDDALTISVVIPAYNSGRYVGRAIDSVLRQTRPADEIIVVDDGSTDNTAEAVAAFADRVRFIRQPNSGASVARNTGIEAATGGWIAFLDADDEWLDHKLQLQVDHLKRHPDLVWTISNYYHCSCNQEHFKRLHDQGRSEAILKGREYFDNYFDAYRNGTAGHTGNMLIRKDVLLEAGLFRPGQLRMNDEDMWFRIAYRHLRVGYVSFPLSVYHRDVADSIIKKHNDPELIIDFLQRHLSLARQQGVLEAFFPAAQNAAKMWIHWSWEDQRIYKVRRLLKELGHLLPTSYKAAAYVLTIFPGLTLRCMPLLRKINKVLKLPM